MVDYTEKVMDYFLNPRNSGKIENADGSGQIGNPVCGDIVEMYIKVGINKSHKEYIKEIKFKTLGCAAAIATSSALTELVKNKTFEEALKITKDDIVKFLGGLPPIKVHCSNLADEALKKAINNYLENKTKNKE